MREVGPYFMLQAKYLLDLSIVGDVRGMNFMMGVELLQDKVIKASFPLDVHITELVFKEYLQCGVVVRPVDELIILSPPLILEKEHIDTLLSALKESIEVVAKRLA